VPTSTDPLRLSDELGIERTRLAHDRTMLAWVRTATSLITFGFSIHNFFAREGAARASQGWIGPREVSLLMVVTGLISLVLASIQHRSERRKLQEVSPAVPHSPAAALAIFIAILGIASLISILVRG
jgi:putative membrane protein